MRILIVEDDHEYLQRILNLLARHGYAKPDTARNEHEAQQCLAAGYYDVIVTDMRLEGNSGGGFAVVEEVERLSITSVVIVLTANETVADCREALRGGGRCWDYISKMMEVEDSPLEELHRSIEEAIAWYSGRGKHQDEAWIKDNFDSLQHAYPDQFIAVMNNAVIENASTEAELRELLKNKQLPLLLPLIRKITVELPRDMSIVDLIRQERWSEGQNLEFKSTLLFDINKEEKNEELRFQIIKTIASFMNADGGTLLIGVTDDKKIYGIGDDLQYVNRNVDKQNNDGFELNLRNAIGSQLGLALAPYIQFRFERINERTVCAVDVLKSPEPAFLKRSSNREFYIRSGNQSRALNVEEMYDYLRKKNSR